MNPNNTTYQRQCSNCKEIKQLTEEFFYKKKNSTYGFRHTCKNCEKNSLNERKKKPSKEKVRERERRRYQNPNRKLTCKIRFYRNSDKKKGLEFNLTREEFKVLIDQPCTYCGFPSTGIDRKDNSLGHIPNNCVPCCKECNTARMDQFSCEEMLIIGRAIRQIKLDRIQKP